MAPVDAGAPAGVKIVLVGPESTGKTTLAQSLAAHYGVAWVGEVARNMLADRMGYDADDLDRIARAQLEAEQRARMAPGELVIVDTDLLVIDVWWRERFGRPPEWLTAQLREATREHSRRYLLCFPDLPWEPDPLRENPTDRDRLLRVYRRRLDELTATYRSIGGVGAERLAAAVAAVDAWRTEL